jgi:voltage-gated potassium channel
MTQIVEGKSSGQADYITPGILKWRRYTNGTLLVFALTSLPLLLLEFKRDELAHADQVFLDIVHITVLGVFALDYLVEVWLTNNRRAYMRHEYTSVMIVIAQALFLIPAAASVSSFRVVRAARMLQVVAIFMRWRATAGLSMSDGRVLLKRNAARLAISVACIVWLSSAVGFTLVEDVGANGRLHSFGDALWWATATIATVGYGDVVPITPLGRLIGGFLMVVGVSAFAVLTARFAELLTRKDS